MPFHQPGAIRYYTFDLLDASRVRHAVFTRRGGASPPPWASLNMGGMVGDDADRVRENRSLAFRELGREPETMYDSWLVHSADVVVAEFPRPLDTRPLQADVILTDRAEVTLFMRFADCVPILLVDPRRQVVGMVHAGWLGTVRGVARQAVLAMQHRFGSLPEDILAGIGPSIGAHHYQVGQDVVDRVHASFGADAPGLLPSQNGSIHFDLWAANRLQMEQAGVRNIEVSGICTACHLDDWYSHRGENGRTGRFGALIGLQKHA